MPDSLDPRPISTADDIDLAQASETAALPKLRPEKTTKPEVILPKNVKNEMTDEATTTPSKVGEQKILAKKTSSKLLSKLRKQTTDDNLDIAPTVATTRQTKTKPSAKATIAPKNDVQNVAEWMDREYRGISIYAVFMGVLLALILWTGISTVRQIQAYHQQYTDLQKIKKEYRKLQIERQRLLIEQQTFSATPQIARRAVTELNMFYPKLSDRLIIQLPAPVSPTSTNTREANQ